MSKKRNRKASLNPKYREICENLGWNINEYADDFDPDEHIEMWIEARKNGVAGVPTTRELVHDAEAIQKMLKELAEALMKGKQNTIREAVAGLKEEQR